MMYHTIEDEIYWEESACYQFTRSKVDRLDIATAEIYSQCLQSVEEVIRRKLFSQLLIPDRFVSAMVDDLEVDLHFRRVKVHGKEVQLTPTEYDLLRLFVTHPGKVLTHAHILKQIWGLGYVEQPHVLRVNISILRHKIERMRRAAATS